MSFYLECRKVKRTGFLAAFICGGFLAAIVPVLNMAVRSEIYIGLPMPPVQILLEANWQMMAMLNVLLAVSGACIMYHTEYADNAIQKMCSLPKREDGMFFGKLVLMAVVCMISLTIEAAAIVFCTLHWFEKDGNYVNLVLGILKNFGYFFLLMLPVMSCSLFIASACRNMWISLGIGVICVFTAEMLPMRNFVLSLFPYALPFQIFAGTQENIVRNYAIAGAVESVVIVVAEMIFLRIRRWFA